MPGPTREQTWEETKKFWRSPGAGKKALGAVGQAILGGGMVGKAATELETTPAARERSAGLDAGELGKKWDETFK